MVNHTKKYDWAQVQQDYDAGLTYRGISAKYSMSQQSIANARKRGDIKTRSNSVASKIRFERTGPTVMGQEAKVRQSKRMSENNPGGRSSWFEVAGKKVQGTWERDFALYLEENKIEWTRCKSISYVLDEKERRYTPDFYLIEHNIYVEIKGYWWGDDKRKMEAVINQHQDKEFLIIEDLNFDEIMP